MTGSTPNWKLQLLGFWQLRRMEEKRAYLDEIAARISNAPIPLPEVPELPKHVDEMQQADTQDFPDLIGVLLADRYRVESLLAVGSVCEVYRARHLYLDRFVALKTARAFERPWPMMTMPSTPTLLSPSCNSTRRTSVEKRPNCFRWLPGCSPMPNWTASARPCEPDAASRRLLILSPEPAASCREAPAPVDRGEDAPAARRGRRRSSRTAARPRRRTRKRPRGPSPRVH